MFVIQHNKKQYPIIISFTPFLRFTKSETVISTDIILDHVVRAQNLLIEQFEESQNLNDLVEIYTKQLQDLEYIFHSIIDSRNIEQAYGKSLDIIGERIGELRNNLNDSDYRNAIYFRIFLNSSYGTPEDLIKALEIFVNAQTVKYSEPYSATVHLFFQTLSSIPSDLQTKIEKISPTGIKIILNYQKSLNNPFILDEYDSSIILPNDSGLAEFGKTGGGELTELL